MPNPADVDSVLMDSWIRAFTKAQYAEVKLEDAMLEAMGIDPDDVDSWPFDDWEFDAYDKSVTFSGLRDLQWKPTAEQKEAASKVTGLQAFFIAGRSSAYCS